MRIAHAVIGLVAALALPVAPLAAQAPTQQAGQAAYSAARAAIAGAIAVDHIPALTVAVYRGDELVWNAAFGTADLENDIAATPETLFRTGSVAKVFTATLAARLAEQGRIDLDRPIGEYLDAWPDRHPPITLRQLLGHLGGIRHYAERDYDWSQPGGMIDLRPYADDAAILALFAEDDLVAVPGERFSYSTFGYTLIGLILEAATGESYFDLLRTQVLEPTGIERVYVDNLFAVIPERTAYYDPIADYEGFLPESMGPVVNALPLNSAYKIPGGGLIADAAALARFGSLHYAPGFLGEEMFATMMTAQRNAAGEATGTGLGWRIATDEAGRTLYHHSGSQQGSRANLAVYPDARISIAIMTNLGNRPRDVAGLSARIAESFLP